MSCLRLRLRIEGDSVGYSHRGGREARGVEASAKAAMCF